MLRGGGWGWWTEGFLSLGLKILPCSLLFLLPYATTFLWKTEGILAATVFVLLPLYGVPSISFVYFFISLSISTAPGRCLMWGVVSCSIFLSCCCRRCLSLCLLSFCCIFLVYFGSYFVHLYNGDPTPLSIFCTMFVIL